MEVLVLLEIPQVLFGILTSLISKNIPFSPSSLRESIFFAGGSYFWQDTNMPTTFFELISDRRFEAELRTSLKKFAFTLCRNFDEAEDLVQKTYEKALINQKKFLGGNARSWMFSIMRNLFIDSTRRITEELPGDDLQEVPVEGNQLSDIEEEEMQSALERSIDKLTPQEKDVISLIRSDLSIAEISETLNLSNGNVRQIIRRAKIKLCELMDAEQ